MPVGVQNSPNDISSLLLPARKITFSSAKPDGAPSFHEALKQAQPAQAKQSQDAQPARADQNNRSDSQPDDSATSSDQSDKSSSQPKAEETSTPTKAKPKQAKPETDESEDDKTNVDQVLLSAQAATPQPQQAKTEPTDATSTEETNSTDSKTPVAPPQAFLTAKPDEKAEPAKPDAPNQDASQAPIKPDEIAAKVQLPQDTPAEEDAQPIDGQKPTESAPQPAKAAQRIADQDAAAQQVPKENTDHPETPPVDPVAQTTQQKTPLKQPDVAKAKDSSPHESDNSTVAASDSKSQPVQPEVQQPVIQAAAQVPAAPVSTHATPQATTAQPAVQTAIVTTQDFSAANHDRIVTGVRSQLLPNGGTMRIQLDPPQLGSMEITVRMVDGAMTASFQTSNDQATQLLSHSLGQLKQALETQGVSVEKLHVEQMPRDPKSGSSGEDKQQGRQSAGQEASAQRDQQRRETLQRMWRRLRLGRDPLDTVA